jgi:hypothetical protein
MEDLENSQPLHIAKNEKSCSWEHTNGMAEQSLHKDIGHGFNQHPEKKQRIQMGLYQTANLY